MKGVPAARAVRTMSILAAGISSAAVIALGLVALEVSGLLAERSAILRALEPALGDELAPLRRNFEAGGSYLAVMAVAITALALSALAIPFFVQMLLRQMDRQAAQADALSDSEERLRAITENAPDAIVMIDERGTVQFWNPGAERLFGFPPVEALGRNLHHLLALPEDAARARVGLEAFAVSGKGPIVGRRRDVTARRADGTTFRAELSIAPVRQGSANWAVGLVRDVTAEHKAAEQLRELARTDSLTGLINRRELVAVASEEIARARRYGRPLSLLAIDLDHFKRVNDTYGHASGDEVLRDFTHRLRASLRSHDIAARIGGEEFVAVLPETTAANAMLLARRLCATIAAEPARVAGRPIPYTISIGVAEVAVTRDGRAPSADVAETLLLDCMARADAGLYAAKEGGRNRVAAGPDKTIPSAVPNARSA